MKKRSLFTLLMVLLCLVCALTLAACDEEPEIPGNDPNTGDETPHTHAYGDWTVTTPATCTAVGVQTRTCNCGASETQPIAATGEHAYNTNNVCTSCNFEKQYTTTLIYELNQEGNAYTVVGMRDENVTTIVVPNYYEGLPVTCIASYAFGNGENVTELQISASISSIEGFLFNEERMLSSISVEKGNTTYHSVNDCLIETATKTLVLGCNNSIIPTDGSVTAIGEIAFGGCLKLTDITIPEAVTSIGPLAFALTGLTDITIPASVTSIGENAFYCCWKMIEVYNLSSLNITAGSADNGFVGYYAKDIYTSTDVESKQFTDSDGYIFYDDGTSRYLIGYTGTDTALTLPASCKGNNYEIYHAVFSERNDLTSVSIPAGVTSMGADAFAACNSLKAVYITDLAAWCNISFASGSSNPLNNEAVLYLNGTPVTALEIPSTVTTIKNYAFDNCTSITSITVPASVTSIGEWAFYRCFGLTTLNFEDNSQLMSIGRDAFSYCRSLKTVNFGDNNQLTGIGENAFADCESLIGITFPSDLTAIGNFAFTRCYNLVDITVPQSVTSIGSSAFRLCYKLIEVCNLSALDVSGCFDSNSVKNIYTATEGESKLFTDSNGYVFYDDGASYYLMCYTGTDTALTLPANYKGSNYEIYRYAFSNRNDLTSVTVPASVMGIGVCAFSDCYSLTAVNFENNSRLTSIGGSAFTGCGKLTSFTIPESVTSIGSNAFFACAGIIQTENGVSYVDKWVIDCDTGVTSVTLRADIVGIGESAFYWCSSLRTVNFGDNSQLKRIGEWAFSCCTDLTSVTLPAGVTDIGEYAFYECSSLRSITIPPAVTSIGQNAFADCTNLTEIYYNATCMDDLNSSEDIFYGAGRNENGITVRIGANVTRIPANMFYDSYGVANIQSYKITSIVFPENSQLTSIGQGAFYGCIGLTDVYIADLAAWCNLDFSNYDANPLYYAKNLYINGNLVTSLEIPNTVTGIKKYAFVDCDSITSVIIPAGVTSIGECAFNACRNLTSITISASVTSIGAYAFNYCNNLTTVNFGDNSQLTSIGDHAFGCCTQLDSITIPSSVKMIGKGAFDDCSLKNLAFENTEGWWWCWDADDTSGTEIAAAELSDPAIAKDYFTDFYGDFWYLKHN